MRPKSIILFERLFLASILLTAISAFLSFDQTLAQLETDPAFRALGWGSAGLTTAAIGYVIVLLLLDYLIAHRASIVAKWVLVLLTVLSMTTLPEAFAVQFGPPLILAVLTNLCTLAAVIMLFMTDARNWLGSPLSSGPNSGPNSGPQDAE